MAARSDWLRGQTFSHVPTPADFPKESLVDVRTYDWEKGELAFQARVVAPSSASHLRIRADDGLVFVVPAADCRLVKEAKSPFTFASGPAEGYRGPSGPAAPPPPVGSAVKPGGRS